MADMLEYKSTGVELFDKWSDSIFIFMGSVVLLWFLSFSFKAMFGYSICIVFFMMLYHIVASISIIIRNGDEIILSDRFKKTTVNNIRSIESWWCYESPGESGEFTGGIERFFGPIKMQGYSNKINIFVRINSQYDSVVLREQIHLSSKFPNNHIYKVDQKVRDKELFKIWDVDKCIKKLELMDLVKQKSILS